MPHDNYGSIDRDMVMGEFVTAHVAYDKEGNRYHPDPDTGTPTVGDETWTDTFFAHIKPFTKRYPRGVGANAETSVFNLPTLEIWWVPVWPYHYKEWNVSWYYLNLQPFSE